MRYLHCCGVDMAPMAVGANTKREETPKMVIRSVQRNVLSFFSHLVSGGSKTVQRTKNIQNSPQWDIALLLSGTGYKDHSSKNST